MKRRPTISDLAAAAGVSVATVDRVLNRRLPVRAETARRVSEAAAALGYQTAGLLRRHLAEELPQLRLGFVLQKPGQPFYRAFERELMPAVEAAAGIRGTAVVEFAASQTPAAACAALERLAPRVEAIAMVAPDHPSVTAAVAELKGRGMPVFALLSDFAARHRAAYVGMDNLRAGRTAGWMIATAAPRPGKVALIIGSHRFHGQDLREQGLRAYLRERAPDFTMLDTLLNMETRQIAREATLALLNRHDDLVGLYVAGGGMEGAVAALREARAAGRLAVVVSELMPESRAGLAEGLVTMAIGTPLVPLCRSVVALMANRLRPGSAEAPPAGFLPFDVFLPESV